MLSVILLILKIIGIALLVLLSIVLFLVLIILFVPIRYRVKVEHGDIFILEGGVSWLLHFIHARISQSGNKRRIWIRIMGILIFDSLRPPKKKKVRSRTNKREAVINHSKRKDSDKVNQGMNSSNIEDDDNDIDQEKSVASDRLEDLNNKDIEKGNIEKSDIVNVDIKNNNIKNYNNENDNVEKEEKPGNRITGLYQKIRLRIISFFKGIKNKLEELIHKLKNIKNKVSIILNFIDDDMNKSGFRFTFNTLKKLLKHILPRTLKSRLIFGTGDPCSTGQLLGVFSILYSFYGDKLQITPDFENKVFIGSHYARGRIRIWTLLIIVIKLLLDKRFKDLKMNYQLLKEAL